MHCPGRCCHLTGQLHVRVLLCHATLTAMQQQAYNLSTAPAATSKTSIHCNNKQPVHDYMLIIEEEGLNQHASRTYKLRVAGVIMMQVNNNMHYHTTRHQLSNAASYSLILMKSSSLPTMSAQTTHHMYVQPIIAHISKSFGTTNHHH